MPTKEELVAKGVKHLNKTEVALTEAIEHLQKLSPVYNDAYAIGAARGGQAIKLTDKCNILIGEIANIRTAVVAELHEPSTKLAKAADVDISTPYDVLPNRLSSGNSSAGAGR